MTETSNNPMKALYKRLSAVKLTTPYLKSTVLPDWWQDSMAEAKSGHAEALAFISRHTGILIDSMLDDNYPLTFADVKAKYYLGGQNTQNEIALAAKLATAAATQVSGAIKTPYAGIASDAKKIRSEILSGGADCVSFEALLKWCWHNGIGVIPINKFPPRQTKMKAMLTYPGKNPVIVLCDNHVYHAWQLFHLAHEIGHLALGHVPPNTEWIDAEISHSSEKISGENYSEEENAATQFGVALITGENEPPLHSQPGLFTEQIVAYARDRSAKLHIDQGFIALNHGWRNGREGASMSALRMIEPAPKAQQLMHHYLQENLDTDLISEDTITYLLRLGKA